MSAWYRLFAGFLVGVCGVFGVSEVFAQTARPAWVYFDSRPVPEKIQRAGGTVRYTSRWLNAVSVDADAKALERIRKIKGVTKVEAVGRVFAQGLKDATDPKDLNAEFDSAFYGPNWRAIQQLGIPSAHQLNFTGRNIRIAILDTGFEPQHEALRTRQVIAQRDFIGRDNIVSDEPQDTVRNQEQHGTWVWSVLGGHAPGKLVGPAFDASFILAKVDVNEPGDVDRAADEDRWVAAVEWADSMGARVIVSALTFKNFSDKPSYPTAAFNGDSTLSARMADEAARRGILVVNSMGNFGPEPLSLQTPADADSIIAVGAVDYQGQPAFFGLGRSTGRGPTADGRLKPELAAPGVDITVARSFDLIGYDVISGTSVSTAFVAGGAAMFMQAWPNLTIMAAREALIRSASRAESPDNNVGYGVPNISSAILFPEGLNAIGITTVNLANQLTTVQPTFTWSAPLINSAMRPVRYQLQIATDRAFSNIIYSDTVTEAFSLTVKRPLRPAPELYWRVVANAFPNVTRSTRVAGPFSVPDWVRLLNLNQPGTFTDSLRPTFRWEALAAPPPSGPLTFELQVLNASSGTPVVTIPNLTSTTATPPTPLTPNISYRWRVIARSTAQTGSIADTVESIHPFVVTSESQPPATLLYQNFPNPFPNTSTGDSNTRIWFDVNVASAVELAVYDLRGRLVRRLIPATPSCGSVELQPGIYGRSPGQPDPCVLTQWDARDENGNVVPRGVYILRLRAGGIDQVKKIVYLPE